MKMEVIESKLVISSQPIISAGVCHYVYEKKYVRRYSRNGTEMKAIESKAFTSNEGESRGERGDPLYSGKSHYVDENKWCKNIRFGACHYVDENTST